MRMRTFTFIPANPICLIVKSLRWLLWLNPLGLTVKTTFDNLIHMRFCK